MNKEILFKELQFKAVRSSGAGGQHVNKVSSKIELSFNVLLSEGLTDEEKEMLNKNIKNRLTKDGFLLLSCGETRSQHRNKELVIKRFFELITLKVIKQKVRKASKPTKASIQRKAENKRRNALKKSLRKKPKLD